MEMQHKKLRSNSANKQESDRTKIRVPLYSLQSTVVAISGFSALKELRDTMWKRRSLSRRHRNGLEKCS